ncbi:MAG: polysulfide reductase NrfD [Myxococcales bacterium]|nr:polysulfide reductase NrfD [Myxococcales bacterium]MCB9649627.1 polysulfide reductase NrfD [Deltaproteobacteria bacterium]
MKDYLAFLRRSFALSFVGDWRYYAWMTLLTVIALIGLNAWAVQMAQGLGTTGMTNQVSWGAYIANFTYFVGIAAAAVMLVIPAYLYKTEPLKKVVIFGELLAVAVIVVCLAFVTVDLGRPDRFWHMIPLIGKFNWPISMLSWDVVALSGYLLLNMHIAGYLIYKQYLDEAPNPKFYKPFVFISIVWAISIHTVTAFLYVGLGGRSFWHSAIVAPRFLASAFAAGPSLIILTFQVIRHFTRMKVEDEALFLLRRIVVVAMVINLFLLMSELFAEFYPHTFHVASAEYLWFGLHGADKLVPWIWIAVTLNVIATAIFLSARSHRLVWLNAACVLAIVGIWVEKGMGLIVPGFVPTPLGEVVEYGPTFNESLVCLGILALGALLYTIMIRVAIPVVLGGLRREA